MSWCELNLSCIIRTAQCFTVPEQNSERHCKPVITSENTICIKTSETSTTKRTSGTEWMLQRKLVLPRAGCLRETKILLSPKDFSKTKGCISFLVFFTRTVEIKQNKKKKTFHHFKPEEALTINLTFVPVSLDVSYSALWLYWAFFTHLCLSIALFLFNIMSVKCSTNPDQSNPAIIYCGLSLIEVCWLFCYLCMKWSLQVFFVQLYSYGSKT